MTPASLIWERDHLLLLDQTKLPGEISYLDCRDYRAVAEAIKTMRVRGAPAIGVAAGFGLALAAQEAVAGNLRVEPFVREAAETLRLTRPTAVNLRWALERVLSRVVDNRPPKEIAEVLAAEAETILMEDRQTNLAIGQAGQTLLRDGATILTHCNTGALATCGYGTALGVIRAAVAAGKRIYVYADETRPLLQGARLTTLELLTEGIPVTLICDNMAAALMRQRRIDAVIVGADRIAKNGDAANKIGTYGLAVLAKAHAVPFYVAVPMSTYDPSINAGDEILIEERDPDEVRCIGGVALAPPEVQVWNPAFDVTPAELVTAIITEHGVAKGEVAGQLAEWHARERHLAASVRFDQAERT